MNNKIKYLGIDIGGAHFKVVGLDKAFCKGLTLSIVAEERMTFDVRIDKADERAPVSVSTERLLAPELSPRRDIGGSMPDNTTSTSSVFRSSMLLAFSAVPMPLSPLRTV